MHALGKAQEWRVTCLLLRKQLWMTFMIKFAASRSVMLGLNLCLGEMKGHLWQSVPARSLLVWPSVVPDPFQKLVGHLGSSRPSCYSRSPVCFVVLSGHKRFLGGAPTHGQPFPNGTYFKSLIVWPRKQGKPVSNMSVTRETTASM